MPQPPSLGNLLAHLPPPGEDESFEILLDTPACRIERIVSHGHTSPPGFWYDQDGDEWVLLMQGQATLAFADGGEYRLTAGDWVHIPAHCRHRVTATAPATVWLAVHVGTKTDTSKNLDPPAPGRFW